jgi:Na+-translocating ferredoxin:NAD+ oxidoreductase RnfC subunit
LLPKAVRTADTNVHGERRACVACGYCENVCPVGLIPHLLHKHADKEIYNERLAEYKIFDCIECGLCDYVCPSKIHIAADIKKAKEALEAIEISHNKYVIPDCDMVLEAKEVEADE